MREVNLKEWEHMLGLSSGPLLTKLEWIESHLSWRGKDIANIYATSHFLLTGQIVDMPTFFRTVDTQMARAEYRITTDFIQKIIENWDDFDKRAKAEKKFLDFIILRFSL